MRCSSTRPSLTSSTRPSSRGALRHGPPYESSATGLKGESNSLHKRTQRKKNIGRHHWGGAGTRTITRPRHHYHPALTHTPHSDVEGIKGEWGEKDEKSSLSLRSFHLRRGHIRQERLSRVLVYFSAEGPPNWTPPIRIQVVATSPAIFIKTRFP